MVQPPSGGCVLKLYQLVKKKNHIQAATFGWLCVETSVPVLSMPCVISQPPSGGCVLKLKKSVMFTVKQNAATFGWLCVETLLTRTDIIRLNSSHLRVAVCGNFEQAEAKDQFAGSHLRVAVCWNKFVLKNKNLYFCSHLRVAVCWNRHCYSTRHAGWAATFGWLCVET